MLRFSRQLLACFFQAIPILLYSQDTPKTLPCGSDYLYQTILKVHPEVERTHYQMEEMLYERQLAKMQTSNKDTVETIVLPVVFHIIHQNGPENIPDERIQVALDFLNKAFSHTGAYAQNGPGADVRIQFCLAQRAPDGTPTSGITRMVSPLTNVLIDPDDDTLKNLVRWDPFHYINIWVVNSILSQAPPGATAYLGYALLPFAVGSDRDGIVIVANSTGAATPGENGVLAHEMGHYLGLYHTFEGGCTNDNCLTQGDRVCDTPPDQGTFTACTFNSCHTDTDAPAPNTFSTDTLDMTDNFLDYSPAYCRNRFTEGQAERMRNLTMSNRVRLLDSPACLEACITGTTAAIAPNGPVTMQVGDTLFLQNLSQNAVQYAWYVDEIATAQTTLFNYVPNQLGWHQIKLLATGATPNCIATADVYVNVICNLSGSIEASSEIGIPGEAMQFQATIDHADQFEWTVNGVLAGIGPDLSTTFPQVGTYTVQVSASNAFCSLNLLQTVPVPPYCAPAAPPQLGYYYDNCTIDIYAIDAYPNGDLLLAGAQCGKPMLARLGKDGSVLWAKRISQQFNSDIRKVSILPDYTAIIYGLNNYTPFLAKIDDSGSILWIRNLFPSSNAEKLAVQENGNILIGLSGQASYQYLDPYGQTIWERSDTSNKYYYLQNLCPRTGGGFYALHNVSQTTESIIDRIDESGQIVWSKKIKPTDQNVHFFQSFRIVPEPDGGFSCCFITYNGFACVAKWANDGNLLWANRYSTNSNNLPIDAGTFFKKTPDHGYLYSASKHSITNGNGFDSQILTKIDSSGAVKWSFSASGFDRLNGVDYTPLSKDAVEWQGETAIPLKVNYGDFFYLMKTNQSGYAGNCVQQAISIVKQPFTILDENITASLIPALPDTTSIPPVDAFEFSAIGLFPYVECPQYVVCTENCNNGIDDDGDGYIDCYDPQCNCYADQNCTAPGPTVISAHLAWESGNNEVNVLSVPIVANLNPGMDDIPEIVVNGFGTNEYDRVLVFNGAGNNRNQPDRRSISDMYANPASHVAVADVFKDGKPDLFLKTSKTLVSLHKYQLQTSSPLLHQASLNIFENGHRANLRPAFADFDNNGVPDVYAGNSVTQVYNNQNSGNLDFIDIARSDTTKPAGRLAFNNFIYNASSSVAAELLTKSQCNGNSDCDGPELGAGPVMYSVDMTLWDGDPQGITIQKDLNVLDPGSTIWSDGYTATADINLDNIPELVVAGKRNSTYGVYAWNRNGLLKWFPYPENTPLSGGMPCIANVFDDRTMGYNFDYPEIIAVSSNRLTCFNLNMANTSPNAPYWWSIPTTDSLGFTAATAFDFNADGFSELVYHDRTQLRILYGGNLPFPANVDANRNWFSMEAPSATADQYPVVADGDGDGEAEIIFTSFDAGGPDTVGSLRGRLRVLKVNAPSSWTGTRPVWNQYGYSGAQVNDDLSIPAQQQSGQVLGGGQRPLNRFLGQLPAFDSNFKALITAANASASVDSIWCSEESFLIRLRVCNTGLRNLPDSIPIRFYSSNPTLVNASQWGDLQYLQMKTTPGNCNGQIFKVPAVNGITFYAVLNDDGNIPRPYNLVSDFTPVSVLECAYTDNLIQTSLQWNHPNLYLGPDISSCSANAVTLNAGAGFADYQWNNGASEQQYTATGPGVYYVNARDVCGFQQSDTVVISIAPQGQLELGPDHTICVGDTVQLLTNGFETVTWSPASSVSCPSCPEIFTAPTETLVLTATGSNADCFTSDSVRIVVLDLPLAMLSTTPATNGNANGSASAIPLSGVTPFSYQWSTQPEQIDETAINLIPGVYFVTITDANGCSNVQTIQVQSIVPVEDIDNSEILFQIIPNPAFGQFTLMATFDQLTNGNLTILNDLGQTMLTSDFRNQTLFKTIDSKNWPAGMYAVILCPEGLKCISLRVIIGQ